MGLPRSTFYDVLPLAERNTPLGRWIKRLLARVHPNVAVVALANGPF